MSTQTFAPRVRQIALAAGPGVMGRVAQFAALTLLAVWITPDEYGRLGVVQAIVVGLASIVGSTAALTFNTRASALVGDPSTSSSAVFARIACGHIPVLLISAPLGAIVTPMGFSLLTGSTVGVESFQPVLVLVGLAGACLSIADAYIGCLAGMGRLAFASVLDMARGVVSGGFVLLLGATFGADGGAVGLVIGDVILAAVVVGGAVGHRREASRLPSPEAPRGSRVFQAGVVANIAGQVSIWILLWGIQAVAGVPGIALYGVANRFASIVLLAPSFFGKNIVGHLGHEPREGGSASWSGRAFVLAVAGLSVAGSVVALIAVWLFFPDIRDAYPALDVVLPAVLAIASLRAVMIAVGMLCVARGLNGWWALSDVVAALVMSAGVAVVLSLGGGLTSVLASSGVSLLISILLRHVGLRSRGGLT